MLQQSRIDHSQRVHSLLSSTLSNIRYIAAIGLLTFVSLTQANILKYHPRMDNAQWINESSVLSCKMVQPIPELGRAIFDTEAGKDPRFYLQTIANPFEKGVASLRSSAPRWNPDLPELDLGTVPVSDGETAIELDKALSTRLMTELYQGKSPVFLRRAWYADAEAVSVSMSSVTFRDAYQQYQRCLSGLSPVGFDQLERSRVYFEVDKDKLTPKAIRWLDLMVNYLKAATDVNHLYIDGHTDDQHTSTYNVDLSKRRAERVMKYLTDRGVPEEKITLRYHGERYPVKSNKTVAGREYNRRVTLRVELDKPMLAGK